MSGHGSASGGRDVLSGPGPAPPHRPCCDRETRLRAPVRPCPRMAGHAVPPATLPPPRRRAPSGPGAPLGAVPEKPGTGGRAPLAPSGWGGPAAVSAGG